MSCNLERVFGRDIFSMTNAPGDKPKPPPEAAAIMAAMVRMPPKPHEEMKLGKSKAKGELKANRSSKSKKTSRNRNNKAPR